MIENVEEIKNQVDPRQYLLAHGYAKSSPVDRRDEVHDFCPVHGGDNGRNFVMNRITKVCYCHTCKFGGDIFDLHAELNHLNIENDFERVVSEVAEITGVAVQYKGATRTEMSRSVKQPQPTNAKIDVTKKSDSKPIRTPMQAVAEAKSVGTSSYLDRKRVKACKGLLFGKDAYGNDALVVPFKTVKGELKSVQYVHDGGKFFCEKGDNDQYSAKGAFFTIGDFKDGDTVLIGEGLATVLTAWMAEDEKVSAISYGASWNFDLVVNALISEYPNINLIHLLDNDKNETALKKACKFVNCSSISFREPSFEGLTYETDEKSSTPTDFNDLVSMCGQPLAEVKRQLLAEAPELRKRLMDKNNLLSAPKEQDPFKAAVEAPKADNAPASFNSDCQEEVLSYLFKNKYEDIVNSGWDEEHFDPKHFTGHYSLAVEGVLKCWEQGNEVTATQVALNVGNTSPAFYATLTRIETSLSLTTDQVHDRLIALYENSQESRLARTIDAVEKSDLPAADKAEMLRKGLDLIQGESEIVQPQSLKISRILDEILDPKKDGITTGIESIDKLLGGGFQSGKLGILTGGAGSGKTALALQLADNVAASGNIAIYLSVEVCENDLTKRSLKRFQVLNKGANLRDGAKVYEKFAGNIYIIKGHHGMTLAKVRNMVLSIMRQRKTNKVLLVVDPFQRLSSGDVKLDNNNETVKIGVLCSQLKDLSESLNIHILALSDTIKNHEANKDGEGAGRGSYMIDHTADYVMMLKAKRDPIEALYGKMTDGEMQTKEKEDPLFDKVKEFLNGPSVRKISLDSSPTYSLKNDFDKYAALVVSKQRDGARFSPLFIYHPADHLFEEVPVWRNII